MNRFRIQLKNFRAIHEADIKLKGITVLAGENSTGKSTISKFFYHFLNTTMTFENDINEEFIKFCERINGRLDRIFFEIAYEDEDVVNKDNIGRTRKFIHSDPFRISRRNLRNIIDPEEIKKTTEEFKQKITSIARYTKTKKVPLSGLRRILQLEDIPVETGTKPSHVFDKIINLIDKKNKERAQKIENRKEEYIVKKVNALLHSEDNKCEYDIFIDDISLKKENGIIENIEKFNIIYIQPTNDVESIFHNNDSLEKYLLVESKEKSALDKDILRSFTSKKFFDGDIRVLDDKIYYVQNNTSFPIKDCASGVNSIAQLYLLYKNGHIDENSAIIIDEPEVHLHPSWIVEYARLIILLRKKVRATFLIATHSTDIVRSIRDLSEKEGIGKEYNFYLSKDRKSVV